MVSARQTVAHRGAWRFGEFVLDLYRAEVTDVAGAVMPLRPKTLALLGHLVDHAGRMTEREAISDAVWPGLMVVSARGHRAAPIGSLLAPAPHRCPFRAGHGPDLEWPDLEWPDPAWTVRNDVRRPR